MGALKATLPDAQLARLDIAATRFAMLNLDESATDAASTIIEPQARVKMPPKDEENEDLDLTRCPHCEGDLRIVAAIRSCRFRIVSTMKRFN